MQIDIAFGKHRKATRWQNKQIEWAELVAKCRETHRTTETMKEYLQAPKSRQDEIKDIGAFVGGYLANGSRAKEAVLLRQVITLDADFASVDFWENFESIFGCTAFYYSTHKHTPEKPRYRLVILASRPMTPEEYEPACRKITELLGIEQFDHTTYDVNRLMYFPSTAKGAEFVFDECTHQPVDVDKLLSMYRDWKDASSWPLGPDEVQKAREGMAKQGEPTEKPGSIGLFCRAYDIHEAVETFLAGVYSQTGSDNRYTFSGGSTASGMIVYDDKFAYSHHGTDPISGTCCNSFDLVRIHKFGDMDDDVREGTPINKRPSFLAMQGLAMSDAKVKRLNMQERLEDAKGDFGEVTAEELDWMGKLTLDSKGNILSTYDNVEMILKNDVNIRRRFKFNKFTMQVDVMRPVPWAPEGTPGMLQDDDEKGLRVYLGKSPYNVKAPQIITDLLPSIADLNAYHPVLDFLEGLAWDGVKRVDTLLTDVLGAEDTPLNRAFMRKTLCAAVARVHRPGCKFDTVLTLVGGEGTRKSSFIRSLFLGWFSDTFNFSMLHTGNGVRAYEQMNGNWGIEIPEMAGLRKADADAAKSFLGAGKDEYRTSHSSHKTVFLRQLIFMGSTNNWHFLAGQTGNRRFWPVVVGAQVPERPIRGETMDLEEVHQVWAEVMEIWSDEELHLTGALKNEARMLQLSHTEINEQEGVIVRFLEMQLPFDWAMMSIPARKSYFEHGRFEADADMEETRPREFVCVAEIWCEAMNGQMKDLTRQQSIFLHNFMRQMSESWEPAEALIKTVHYGKQRGYRRIKEGNLE